MDNVVFEFIRKFYIVRYSNKNILLTDINESKLTNGSIIDISTNIKFIWNRANYITGIDIYRKDISYVPGVIMEVFRSKKTMDFFRFLSFNNEDVSIPMNYIKEEFPLLYGEKLNEIIIKNKNKVL